MLYSRFTAWTTAMASFRKRGSSWEVFIATKGVRKSASFSTKAAAQAWAMKTENDIRDEKLGATPDKTFGELLQKYGEEVSVGKGGARWEQVRIAAFRKDAIAAVNIRELAPVHFKAWRDRRLEKVCGSTVVREWNILSNACHHATTEWEWFKVSPSVGVKMPDENPPRDRLVKSDELERLMFTLGYSPETPLITARSRIGAAFLFALETAMRAGEMVALEWVDVDTERRYLRVNKGKTDAATRDVPLSAEALRILHQLSQVKDGPSVFQLKSGSLDAMFRNARDAAVIEGLTFHDTRHHAITQLAKKLTVLELARAVGHRDLKQLLVYYNETAEELAKKL